MASSEENKREITDDIEIYDDNEGNVQLGFVEEAEEEDISLYESNWHNWDGGKVGGKPIWLNFRDIPQPEQLQCTHCGEPMTFLLQIYCPLDEINDAFHRMIYLFICSRAPCVHAENSIKVFRCQLPRQNDFYIYEPDSNEDILDKPNYQTILCRICGCRAPKKCSKCKEMNYCSRSHQKLDWNARHKNECNDGEISQLNNITFNCVLPQFEIYIESEEIPQKSDEIQEEHDYENDEFDDDNNNFAQTSSTFNDEITLKFLTRIHGHKNRSQIVRYARWGQGLPLWISSERIPKDEDIPFCTNCGTKRLFEFQIMPQLINFLKFQGTTDSNSVQFDWGTIAVFTCPNSCNCASGYIEEFVWVQPPLDFYQPK